jgi:serine/threonine-protein kinase
VADATPARSAADRNLLFGILALQMDFVSRDALVAGMNAWVLTKSKALGEVLREQGALGAEEHALLEALVKKHLARHGNDAEKSLAAVSSVGSVKEDLRRVADPDLEASLGHVAAGPPEVDHFATRAPSSLGSTGPVGSRFRVLRPHARGGLGEVFVARDQELNREVALKEIQDRHADDPESRSRFMLEAEITGGLEHPGIVPVYGLGTYAEGRPFYAMRFIRGDSLKEAIERYHASEELARDAGKRTLELRALLGRFIDVCQAIDYAHSRGVLHRDLKPGNIMLGNYGETLVVDWGLAKPLEKLDGTVPSVEGPLRPTSLSSTGGTVAGGALGTPQYMSPEQAAGRMNDLGPASDVYSLGATLYCLLTGRPPFTDSDLGTVLHKVQQGYFPPPRQVRADVPRPLEAICLRAMALLPEDRYASPRDLARDVERWLGDEPVSAWEEPWGVKGRRWVNRHRTLVTGAVAALLVAATSLAGGLLLLAQANERLRAANERERRAREQAQEQHEKAEHNYRLARQAVDRYHTEVSESVLLHEPGLQPLRKKLLEAAREFYQTFADQRRDDRDAQGELGKALFRLAQITGEIESEKRAIELHEQARAIFTTAGGGAATPEDEADLAACYHHLGRLYRLTDQPARAEESYGKALAIWERLRRDHPGEDHYRAEQARSQLGLGNVYQVGHRLDRARALYEDALATRQDLFHRHPDANEYQRDLAVTLNNLAMVYGAQGDGSKAGECYLQSRKLQQDLAGAAPHVSQYGNDLARTCYNLGDWYARAGDRDRAEASYQEAADLWRRLADAHPAVTDFQTDLAEAYTALGEVERAAGREARAEDACRQALAIKEKLAASHPDVPSYRGDLARCHYHSGNVYRGARKAADAEAAYQQAVPIQERLVHDLPDVPQYRADLARTYHALGLLRRDAGRRPEAEQAFQKAVGLWQELAHRHPAEAEFAVGLSTSCQALGGVVRDGGNPEAALPWYAQAVGALDAVPAEKQRQGPTRAALSGALAGRAAVLTQLRRYPDAVRDLDRVVDLAADSARGGVRLQRALTLARGGEHARAAAEAAALDGATASPETLYGLGCVYALSAAAATADEKADPAERRRLAEGYAGRAVGLFDRAQAAGYFQVPANLDKLRTSPDLGLLRSRPDFRKVLDSAEGGVRPVSASVSG